MRKQFVQKPSDKHKHKPNANVIKLHLGQFSFCVCVLGMPNEIEINYWLIVEADRQQQQCDTRVCDFWPT